MKKVTAIMKWTFDIENFDIIVRDEYGTEYRYIDGRFVNDDNETPNEDTSNYLKMKFIEILKQHVAYEAGLWEKFSDFTELDVNDFSQFIIE